MPIAWSPKAKPNNLEHLTGYIGCPCRLMGQSFAHCWLSLRYPYPNGGRPPQNGTRTCISIDTEQWCGYDGYIIAKRRHHAEALTFNYCDDVHTSCRTVLPF